MQNIFEKNSVPNYFWGNFDSCSNSFAFIRRFVISRQKNAFLILPYLKGFWSITDEEQPTPPKDDDLREPLFPNAGIFFFVTNSLTCMLQSLEPADFRLKSFFFLMTTLSWAWAGLDEGPPLQKKYFWLGANNACMQFRQKFMTIHNSKIAYLDDRLWLLECPKETRSEGNEPRRQFLKDPPPLGLCSLEAVVAALAAEVAIFWIWLSKRVQGAEPRLLEILISVVDIFVAVLEEVLEPLLCITHNIVVTWSSSLLLMLIILSTPWSISVEVPRWKVTFGAWVSDVNSGVSLDESVEEVVFR